uniref:MARVEL domain-containing protein n=1 Tax=Ciona savignyi TaxID=51511 RepID=H2ZLL5_CIOSA
MSKPTVNYPRNGSYPDQRRRRKQNDVCCDFNSSYAKSLQGICKAISMIVGLLVIIIIGVSPYFRTIFVIGGVTWPFHIVMLFTVCVWLATMFVYFFFLSGQHLQYPHVPWPKWEFIFNVVMSGAVLFAAILEAANVWRWDMSMGMQFNPGSSGSPYNQQLSGLGYQQGMTMTQSINFNSYCTRYPKDCTDYFGLLTGHNSYLGNHIFATVLLFLLLICYLVSTYFSFRTWRVFVRDMVREGEHPKPTSWDRFKFRISEIK